MKIDIILVNLAMVALVVLPYVVFIILSLGESQKLKKRFLLETANYLGKTDEIISWNQTMAALDRTLQKLVLVQRTGKEFRVEVIDLKNMRTCEVKTTYAPLAVKNLSSTILQRIDLEFSAISGEKSFLNLFDHNTTYLQDFELKHAEKLHSCISSCLSFRPVINSAA